MAQVMHQQQPAVVVQQQPAVAQQSMTTTTVSMGFGGGPYQQKYDKDMVLDEK